MQEKQSPPPLPQQQSQPSLGNQLIQQHLHVKSEQQEVPIVALEQSKESQFLKSIEQLGSLSGAISEFYRRYEELQKHLDFIQSAIDVHSEEKPQLIQMEKPVHVPTPVSNITAKQKTVETEIGKTETGPATDNPELISLCKVMDGRGLRKYITSHLSSIRKLCSEVPTALKFAPKPAELVLECVGRFYLQGSRAYTKYSPMIPGRKAGILVLEFFLLMINNGINFDAYVKQEAEQAAVAWRKRLIAEGGVDKSSEIDARGLLLLVGCYGIPKVFTNEDIWDLIRLSNPKQIADALRRSRFLVARASEILERMMNHRMRIEAVDVAYTFGIEEKFPPQKLLTAFLRDSTEASKRRKRELNNLPILLKEASLKQLGVLKSVVKLVEDHNLDLTKHLPGWQISEMIDKLEREIAELDKKIDDKLTSKRKADENEFANNLKSHETKCPRFTGSPLISSPSIGLHELRAAAHLDGNGLYSTSVPMNLLDIGFSGHNNPSVTESMLYGSGVGSLPEHVLGTLGGGGSIMQGAGVGLSASYNILSTSSFPGVHREMLVDRNPQITGSNIPPYGWHGVGDGSRGQSFVHQPASGLFGPSRSIEGFVGLPNSPPTAGSSRISASDLYRFADAVK